MIQFAVSPLRSHCSVFLTQSLALKCKIFAWKVPTSKLVRQVRMLYLVLLFMILRTSYGEVSDSSCGALPKKSWGGANPTHVEYLPRPVNLVIIQHTATPECTTPAACAEVARDIQHDHIRNRDWWDLGPSFLVGGDGRVYEGSGWTHVGAHTLGYNRRSIGISFVGDFSNKQPSGAAVSAAKALIACGVAKGHLTADYQLVGHRQLVALESPGYAFYDKIKSWPHFQRDVSLLKQ